MRAARRLRKLTQEDAAVLLGVASGSTVSKLEAAKIEPSASLIARMAAVYRVPIDVLMNPPETADEVIERRLTSLERGAASLEREDWEREPEADPPAAGGHGGGPRTPPG